MRDRPSSRLLIVNRDNRLLLFKFDHKQGPLAGQCFWGTPGGGLEPGESYEDAAIRELLEETGIAVLSPGPQVFQQTVVLQLPDGETVTGDERFFLIRIEEAAISRDRWTELERQMMTDYHWWSESELRARTEQVWPDDLARILALTGMTPASV
ncbi:NUDIX domain-containing protein [Bradyrhizobium sp. CB82]|uniref:NUDIX hydrolase n=1 Tax=Bradyrhizobium sp. CB82 TaxID=3039159 RepID=UPI0024B10DC9|nr:NUDIX domain-containing protein [Bradyrhizobium sp. CB82]WFU37517.1 NUDIX domain-containing protein [Bradyrhizobium sp. CB82]